MQSRRIFYLTVLCLLVSATFFVGCGGGSSPSGSQSAVQSVVRFSSQPSGVANEGDLYTYTPSAIDTANGTITFAIAHGPNGATLSGEALNWTPTSLQSRLANAFTITATSSAGGSAQQTWTVTPTGVIRGQQLITWHKDDGTVDTSANDLSAVPINAVVIGGNNELTLPGTGAANGTFAISKVPAGYYWLQFGNDYFYTSSSQLDLGFNVLGRADVQFSTGLTRNLQFIGLQPWDPLDYLEWYSSNVDAFSIPVISSIAPGDTVLNDPWSVGGIPMLDDSKGDSAYLTQMVPTSYTSIYGTITVHTIGAFYHVTGITEIDGQVNNIGNGASFTQVLPNASMEGNVKGATIAAIRPSLNPNGSADSTQFSLVALPFGSSHGWIGVVPDLMAYSGPPLTDDEDDGSLSYANPFDPSWPPMLILNDWVKVDYNVPAIGPSPISQFGYTHIATTSLPTGTDGLAPLVGPVVAPKVNGADFFHDQTINTLSPTISWSVPIMGTPTSYVVTVCKWDTVSGGDECGPSAVIVGRFRTRNTRVQVPSGILQAGSSYYFRIKSVFMAGTNIEAAPYRLGLPSTVTNSLSGIVSIAASANASLTARYRRLSRSVERSIQPPAVRSNRDNH